MPQERKRQRGWVGGRAAGAADGLHVCCAAQSGCWLHGSQRKEQRHHTWASLYDTVHAAQPILPLGGLPRQLRRQVQGRGAAGGSGGAQQERLLC